MSLRVSLKAKLTLLVVLSVSIASIAFFYFTANGLLDLLERATGLGASAAAQSLVATVDGDWVATTRPGQGVDNKYRQIETLFERAMDDQGHIRRAYLVRFAGEGEVEHVLNLPVDHSQDYHAPGTTERDPGAPYFSNTHGYSGVELLGSPGVYVAGWAPIQSGGRDIGVLILVVEANDMQHALNQISYAIMFVLAAFIFLSGITAYKFSATFEKTAVTDGLMGIYNHKYFKQRMEQEVSKARRYGQATSLVLLDIDFFKRVNDTYGHATGDITLKTLAKWVSDSVRTTDVVARYGGEEIAIILTHTGIAGAQEFAERLRLKISQQVVKDPGEKAEFRVTVSIGVTQWEKGMDMLDMIKRADAALYHSKRTGRNRVTIYQEEILPAPEPQASQAKSR